MKIKIGIALLVIYMLTACVRLTPLGQNGQDRADYNNCYQGLPMSFGNYLPIGAETRACMDELQKQRQAKLEERQRREEDRRRAVEENYAMRKVAEQASAEKIEALKKECGDDYGKVRVGMSLDRVKQCWRHFGIFRLTSEVNRDDGVLSVYSMPVDDKGSLAFAFGVSAIYVMHGKVVGWTQ